MNISRSVAVTAMILSAFLLSSCVSSKKYKEMSALKQSNELAKTQCIADRDQLTYDLNKMKEDYANLQKEKEALASLTGSALESKQKALEQKEKELQEREKKIKQLTSIIDQQNQAVASLKSKLTDALVGYAPDELSIELRDGKVYVSLSDKLLFPSGSDKVNEKGTEAIKKLAGVIAKSDSTMIIYIEGHTDSIAINTAKYADNWDLSVHRATSIIRILTSNGVDPDQVIASGRGEYYPVASNLTADERQKNRRTEIILSPKLDALWDVIKYN
ncbi:MAG: OmpA family protein [Fimbriimonadaceae bacterium]|nr:OmpA family protein [Chitinophagales bacterium]